MAWTKGKISRKEHKNTQRFAFSPFVQREINFLLLTLAACPLGLSALAQTRESSGFSSLSAGESEFYFQAQPPRPTETLQDPRGLADNAESAPNDIPNVLKQAEMPIAAFIAQYKENGTSPAQLDRFLTGINQLLASHGKAPIGGFELPQKAHAVLTISRVGEGIQISPAAINLGTSGQTIQVVLEGFSSEISPQIFVRNQQLLSWNDFSRTLTASAEGHTEVYIHYQSGMHILPISVGNSQGPATEIAAVNTLTPLPSLGSSADNATSLLLTQAAQLKPHAPGTNGLSTQATGDFRLHTRTVAYTNFALRIVDERSRYDDGKEPAAYFPVAGLTVKLIGTDFSAETDSQGLIKELSAPTNSRLLISLSDKAGLYRPSLHEITSAEAEAKGTLTIKIMRTPLHEQLLSVANLSYDGQLGSLCGIARGDDRHPRAGISVSVDWEGARPLYFNSFGLPELTAHATADNGRFCFFNVPEGPAALTFVDSQNSATLAVEPHSFYAGRHGEKFFDLEKSSDFTTYLASYASPTNAPLGEGNFAYKPLEMVDLWPFGFGEAFKPVSYGAVASAQPIVSTNQRSYYLAQAKDFEQTIYQFDVDGQNQHEKAVTPLFPLGFVDNLLQASQDASGSYLSRDPNLGNVVVEHGTLHGEEGLGQVRIKLFDHNGTDFGEAAYFGESPLRKAIFFNVPPGNYQVVVESTEGHWLAVNTLVVYAETLSYLRTGSPTVAGTAGFASAEVISD